MATLHLCVAYGKVLNFENQGRRICASVTLSNKMGGRYSKFDRCSKFEQIGTLNHQRSLKVLAQIEVNLLKSRKSISRVTVGTTKRKIPQEGKVQAFFTQVTRNLC